MKSTEDWEFGRGERQLLHGLDDLGVLEMKASMLSPEHSYAGPVSLSPVASVLYQLTSWSEQCLYINKILMKIDT